MNSYREYRPLKARNWGNLPQANKVAVQDLGKVVSDDRVDLRFRKATQLIAKATGVLKGNTLDLAAVARQLNQASNGKAFYFPALGRNVDYKTFSDGGVGFHFELELDKNVHVWAHVKFHPATKIDLLNSDVANLHIRIEAIKDLGMTKNYGDNEALRIYFDPKNGSLDGPRKSRDYEKMEKIYQRFGLKDKIDGMMRTLDHLIYSKNTHHDVDERRDLRGVGAVKPKSIAPKQQGMFAQNNAQKENIADNVNVAQELVYKIVAKN